MTGGGFRPTYDVQFATDTTGTVIAGVSVDNIASGMGKMAPMNDARAKQYGERSGQHLADGGFATLDHIEVMSTNGVETFVPAPKSRDANRDRHVPQLATHQPWPSSESAWAPIRPRKSTRSGQQQRNAPTSRRVIAG